MCSKVIKAYLLASVEEKEKIVAKVIDLLKQSPKDYCTPEWASANSLMITSAWTAYIISCKEDIHSLRRAIREIEGNNYREVKKGDY